MVKTLETYTEAQNFIEGQNGDLVVVEYTATWCPPCKRFVPIYQDMETTYQEYAEQAADTGEEVHRVLFTKVDVDANSETAEAHNISCMPTFILYKNGAQVGKLEGASEEKLDALIVEHM